MSAILILPTIVSGYIACYWHPVHYFKLHRFEGQLLYLKVAAIGLFSMICSAILSIVTVKSCIYVSGHCPPVYCIINWIFSLLDISPQSRHNDLIFYKWSTYISIISFILSSTYALYGRIRYRNKKYQILKDISKDNNFEDLLYWSIDNDGLLLITLKSEKVYVGNIINTSLPDEKNGPSQEISIFPLMSGYRDPITKKVTFTNAYDTAGRESDANEINQNDTDQQFTYNDFAIIIPRQEITTTSKFDIFAYSRINSNIEPA